MSSALGIIDHFLLLVLGLRIRLSIVVGAVEAALIVTGDDVHGLLYEAHPLVGVASVLSKLASLFERAESLFT